MRVVAEIPHPKTKITIFSWNGRYLVKFEYGFLEQTYKVSEMDLTSENDINEIVSEAFVSKVMVRFLEMEKDFGQAINDVV
ncbi:hypothetical protein [Imperialibacter roseus]|uniref:KTSC domain-containing protein n=1 Tax=Imperialibacter roseus TaxID=1324217 RepID=A0ABZ0IM20_9BACT|nr:hypothetical protein [Imperialibacter roseus]WOK05035.1 hypothetical protein RT717_18295 [Imperialibacter roseus]|tara:strand:- start:18982 stop:19224 length:243 start_codon:yes stop_codon:yes gene_type:complete